MNYISLLNNEEIETLCNLISGREFKTLFKKNPNDFAKIKPGFRAQSLSEEAAVSLAIKNISKSFISYSINLKIESWLEKIDEKCSKLFLSNMDEASALAQALAESVFSNHIELYFKLHDKKTDDFYLDKLRKYVPTNQESASVDSKDSISVLREQLSNREQKLENYKSKLQKLREENASLKQDLEDAQKLAQVYQQEKQEIERKLVDFRIPTQFDDTEDEIDAVVVSDFDYVSLCEVVVQEYKHEIYLNRLADIKSNGSLEAFHVKEDIPKRFSNRSKIFFKDGPHEPGTIGVWNWSAIPNNNDPSRDYVIATFNPEIRPIEIIVIQNCKIVKKVLERLKVGFEIETTSENIIFAANLNKGQFSGFLCRRHDFEQNGSQIKLKKNVISLPRYDFSRKDIIQLSNDKTYFNSINGMPSEVVNVKDPMDIVRTVIFARNSWQVFKQQGKSRSEWRSIRNFLENLDTVPIIDDISNVVNCSEHEAQKMLDDFIKYVGNYVDGTTIEDQIISTVVETNPELMDRCKALIMSEWIDENKSEIDNANAKLDKLRKEHAQIKEFIATKKENANKELSAIKREHDDLQKTLQDLNHDISSKEQFALDVEKAVERRIHQAQNNAAEFIAKLAFVPRASTIPNDSIKTNTVGVKISKGASLYYYPGSKLGSDEIEENTTWEETLDTLSYELIEAGVIEQFSRALAAYMYAAYLNKVSLLMIGPNGDAIVDAFSRAVFGRRAGCLQCTDKYDPGNLEECLHSEDIVINISDPFRSTWVTYIPRLVNSSIMNSGNKYFIITYPYSEDIQIEPKSLYNYILPIFTELFVYRVPDQLCSGNIIGGSCAEEYKAFTLVKTSKSHDKLLTELHTPLMTRNKIQTLLSNMHIMLKDENSDYDVIFALLPYAYATMQTPLILEAIQDKENKNLSISNNVIELINRLYGDSE